MKHFIWILAATFFSYTLMAQKEKPLAPKLPSKAGKDERVILDFTLDNWTDSPQGVEVETFKSRGFNLKLMGDHLIGESRFSLGLGLGLGTQNFHTNAAIITNDSASYFNPYAKGVEYDVNKLNVNYLDVPFEVRFRSKAISKGNKIKVSAGGLAGVLLQSHVKFKDASSKYKGYGIDHLNKFRYGVTGRIGYGRLNFTGYYALSTLFEDNKGPEITPISFGISIIPY